MTPQRSLSYEGDGRDRGERNKTDDDGGVKAGCKSCGIGINKMWIEGWRKGKVDKGGMKEESRTKTDSCAASNQLREHFVSTDMV
jgi:hypothetical protein